MADTNKTFQARFKHKRDTAANWEKVKDTFQPYDGELIVVDTAAGATRFKVGRYDAGKARLLYYGELPFTDEYFYSAANEKIGKLSDEIEGKVDKIDGKNLSTNDYTNNEKDKLSKIADGANKTVVDSALSDTSTNPVQNKIINAALKTKASSSHTHQYAGSASSGGAATSAVKLSTARSITTNLSSNEAGSFDGTKSILVGVSGTLPTNYGGTGANNAADARDNLNVAIKNTENFTTYGGSQSTITNLLLIDSTNAQGPNNQDYTISVSDASTLTNSPVTSGAFRAYRKVIPFKKTSSDYNIMVLIFESYPVEGRIWERVYNSSSSSWSDSWKQILVKEGDAVNNGVMVAPKPDSTSGQSINGVYYDTTNSKRLFTVGSTKTGVRGLYDDDAGYVINIAKDNTVTVTGNLKGDVSGTFDGVIATPSIGEFSATSDLFPAIKKWYNALPVGVAYCCFTNNAGAYNGIPAGVVILTAYKRSTSYGVIELTDYWAEQYKKRCIINNGTWSGFLVPYQILNSTLYGSTLPTAGTKGRIFFKKA